MPPLLCSSVPRPSDTPALMHGISSGVVVRHQFGAAPEQRNIISALRDRKSIAGRRRRIGRKSGSLERRINIRALTYGDRTLSTAQNGSADADPATSSRRADLAFQRAMQRAIAAGLEHPPLNGVFKDVRPLNAPRLFAPAPHSSGCTSPALECAELVAQDDRPADSAEDRDHA